jgi:hypothetical protein
MKNLVIFTLGLIILLFAVSFAGVTKTGTTAATFLKIDVGSRAIGMGSSYVALAEDATAIYWNPGGLTRLQEREVMFCYNRWIADISFNYAAVAIPLSGSSALGASATFLSTDDMEKTTISSPDGTGEMFSVGSYAFALSYAMSLTDRFSIGINVKYIYEYISQCSANGAALDIGTMYNTNFYGVKIGMSISNFGTKMHMTGRDLEIQVDTEQANSGNNANINAELKTDKFELPLLFRFGVATDIYQWKGDHSWIVSIDALHPSDDIEYVNVGTEFIYNKMFALRAGYKKLFADQSSKWQDDDPEEGLCFGAGLEYAIEGLATFVIDYGYHDFGILNNIQMFTITLKF